VKILAGYHIEQMAQHKYDELKKEKLAFLSDAEEADRELDYIMDKSYYNQRDVDRLIDLRNDAQYRAMVVDEEIKNLLKDWEYCITL
jgi:hypothetical protein